jgi:hypothetical protein
MLITIKDLQRVFATIFFAAAYHALYIDYVHPMFGYMHYRLEHREWFQWLVIYAFAVVPSLWQKGHNDAVGCGISLIYLLLYVPALITMCAMWIEPFSDLIILALALMVGQIIIQLASKQGERVSTKKISTIEVIAPNYQSLIAIITLASLINFIVDNISHMSLVNFADVYDLRFASRDASSTLSGYLNMWLVGVSIPFYISRAIQCKKWSPLFFAIMISIVIYMGNGAKSALLMPIQAYIVGLIVAHNRNPTQFLAASMGVMMWVLYAFDTELLNLFKSLVIMRLLSSGGWTMVIYHEYFSLHGWTFYSHINLIGAVFGKAYSLGLGQMIGIEYFASEEANYNANFWATDGVAAFGSVGVIIISILMSALLRLVNKLSRYQNQRAIAVLLTGFWLSALNGSLFTSLLSGGGFFILILLYLNRRKNKNIYQIMNAKSNVLQNYSSFKNLIIIK